MKYSRKEIDRAGKVIVSSSPGVFDLAEAIVKIDDWRKLHLPVIEGLSAKISDLLSKEGVPVSFSSQRLKRMKSIKEKLVRTPNMGLGGVQDIGGGRFVFEDMQSLLKAKECIAKATFENYTLDHELYDYIDKPKDSGYRSIHFVYKYSDDNSESDGMRVEIQIRTKLQHDWATAVETAELISNSSLKASQGDQSWLDFFKLVSAIFSLRENQPVNELYRDMTEEDYCRNFYETNNKYKFVDNLKALVGAVDFYEKESFNGGYVLVVIDYVKKRIDIRHFNPQDTDKANEQYAQIEKNIDKEAEAVVLVSVSDMKELREAYPSYFLNAGEFIAELSNFQENCKLKGYIS